MVNGTVLMSDTTTTDSYSSRDLQERYFGWSYQFLETYKNGKKKVFGLNAISLGQ